MGGKVFSTGSDALYTPRMDPKIYDIVLANCFNALRHLFTGVKSPREAPEKTSFGDIDIAVSLEGAAFTQEEINDHQKTAIWASIEKELKAVKVFQERKLVTSKSIAISWPGGVNENVMARQLALEAMAGHKAESERDEASSKAVGPSPKAELTNRFIQVDIQLCSSNQELAWRVFKHDHGDMWNILGAIIRPYGLTATEEALYIRIPEIEQIDKKTARVFLTDSPVKVLEFVMGERYSEWAERFSCVDDMFDYTSRCKWFHAWITHQNEKSDVEAKDSLKSNDRQRMSQRPVLARWVEEYVPGQLNLKRSVLNTDKHASTTTTRDEVRAAAFVAFPGAEERYTQRLAAWNREQTRIFIKSKLIKNDMALPESIVSALPKPQEGISVAEIEKNWRGVLRSALTKLIVNECTDFECMGIASPHVRDEHGALIIDQVKDWIERNWEMVGRAAWDEQCARAAENMRVKQAKQQMLEQDDSVQGQPRGAE